ncbi:flagellar assembly peptidoglycan hydrolase FlgJ [soil metagenome]
MAISPLAGSGSDTRAMDVLADPTATALRGRASSDPKSAIKAAAKQFEALFMQQLMKSMRDTTLSDGSLDNAGSKMGTDMLDQQFANQMTGIKGGLSEAIARQLERQMAGASTGAVAVPLAPAGAAGAPAADTGKASDTPAAFLQLHQDSARAAEAQTGIPATFMVAQAAHESGWGKHEIRNADGSSAHNLFGIKAGSSWKGATTSVTTTEVVDGQARKVVAKFRAYGSYRESFEDYAKLMKNNARYSQVVANSTTPQSFAQGLQKAGYATDPAYADKLTRVINTTLRLQRMSS